MLHSLVTLWFSWVRDWGYWGVFLLMAMESTIIPVPSELVMPPAAFWAAQGHMSFWGVVAAGSIGSYLGSALSYFAFRWLGGAFLEKYGKYFFIKSDKIHLAEVVVQKYGAPGIFIARLLPVVRHLISIPAGIFKMNFTHFSVVTVAGATFWNFILSWWGQKVIGQHPELLESPEQMMHVIRSEMVWFVTAIGSVALLYGLVVWYKRRANAASAISS